jgi:hypothetical protein
VVDAGEETRQEVLASAGDAGFAVSAAQLARWHRDRLLPRPRQQALGRGRGTTTVYPANTATQLVALCRIKSEVRNLDLIAFELWWEGFPIDAERIRPAVRRVAEELDAEIPAGPDTGRRPPRGSLQAVVSRHIGRQRTSDIAEAVRLAAQERQGSLPELEEPDEVPTLDEVAQRTIPLVGYLLAGTPAAQVVTDATDAELIAARDKAKYVLGLFRDWAGLLGWLFGRRGDAFRLFADVEQHLGPDELPGVIVAILMLERSLPPGSLQFLSDQPANPILLRQLQAVTALREQVPGAAEVFTPAAVRAVLRNKEAARRHSRNIEQFMDANRDEVGRVIESLNATGASSTAALTPPALVEEPSPRAP